MIREGVPQIIDTTGNTIVETLWSFADDLATANILARHGYVLVTITDTLTGEAWRRDCGPVSLALRPALLVGSAAHCKICVPGLPPVAAVIDEIPTEDLLCSRYCLSITCDTPRQRGGNFLWEQEELSINLELSHDEYLTLQKGCEPEFLQTGWRMEADDLWLWRNGDIARVSFHATDKGWSATRGWTHRTKRNHSEKYIVPILEAAVGRTTRAHRD